jgi:hypothetical protein
VGDARHDAARPGGTGPGTAPAAAGDGTPAAAAPGSGRPGAGRHRRRRSHRRLLLPLLTVLLVGGALSVLAAGDRWPFAGEPPSQPSASPPAAPTTPGSPVLAPQPATGTPDERLAATTTAVADALAGDPGGLGPAGEDLLAGLRRVQAAEGPARQLAAVVVGDSVTTAVDAGGLDEQAGRQVLDTLAAVARPERLIDLVAMVEAGPPAIGPAGAELFGELLALDHEVPAGETAVRAGELLREVSTAAAEGRVSEAFRAVAAPMLERLADPAVHEDLQELLAAAEADPGRIGPAAPQVLASLRAAAEQPVWPQGNTARDLLALLRQDGQVTTAFREEAVPVVEALVR